MNDIDPDKQIGSWFGMVVGDAMGRSSNGLKPVAIRQIFGVMDDFKDVRPILGKGIKAYRMKGLYGAPTQCALAVADGLLTNKKQFLKESIQNFQALANGGPEGYFGVYRSNYPCLWKAVELLDELEEDEASEQNSSTALFLTLAVPLALFHGRWSKTLARQCFDVCLKMSRNRLEVVGTVLTGFLITRFLSLDPAEIPSTRKEFLLEAEEVCRQAETDYDQMFPVFEEKKSVHALSDALKNFPHEPGDSDYFSWLCDHANSFTKMEIRNPSQGFVLTLVPLALHCVLLSPRSSFVDILSHSLSHGRETEILGSLAGAWAGALYGFENIPALYKSRLVNSKEIRLRAEALVNRRMKKEQKQLFAMEAGMTAKEFEEGKRNKDLKKPVKVKIQNLDLLSEEESFTFSKEDRLEWRKFQKEKTKAKRDRRKNIPDLDDL